MACGDDGAGPDPIACTDDTGTVAVTVSAGLQPMFNWEPACAMALLLVEAGSGDVWGISTDNATWDDPAQANLIAPPITYGGGAGVGARGASSRPPGILGDLCANSVAGPGRREHHPVRSSHREPWERLCYGDPRVHTVQITFYEG